MNNISHDNIGFVNHGGLAVVSRHDINIARLEIKIKPKTFEHMCCRVGGGETPFILAAIYQQVCDLFFKEFSTVLESLATFNCRTIVVGDLNVHLERPTDINSQRLTQLIETFNMQLFVSEPTFT